MLDSNHINKAIEALTVDFNATNRITIKNAVPTISYWRVRVLSNDRVVYKAINTKQKFYD